MGFSEISGFFSYVHDDDCYGYIGELREAIVNEYAAQTAEDLELFFDKDSLRWGDVWERSLEANLASAFFFIPILTPRYFASPYCRREMKEYLDKVSKLDAASLILPVLYIDIPKLRNMPSDDELLNDISRYQWEDWRKLRHFVRESTPFRQAVDKMVKRLVRANQEIDLLAQTEAKRIVESQVAGDANGSDGGQLTSISEGSEERYFFDSLAALEDKMPKFTVILEALTVYMQDISSIMIQGNNKLNAAKERANSVKALLVTMHGMAASLMPPCEGFKSKSDEFSALLYSINDDVRTVLIRAQDFSQDGENLKQFKGYCGSLIGLQSNTDTALQQLDNFREQVKKLKGMSRDLNRPLKVLENGLITFDSACEVIDDWGILAARTIEELESLDGSKNLEMNE